VVPSDGYFLAATDPETTLCMGAGIVHELPAALCQPTWDYEFLVPDYLKFTDVVRSGRHVADLHEATGGRPDRSPRWREYGAATGFRAELRAAFTIGGAAWGVGQFDRLGDAPRYTADEKAWLARVTPVVARGLRQALVAQPAAEARTRGPGIVVLDLEGRVLTATQEAEGWLQEVGPPVHRPHGRRPAAAVRGARLRRARPRSLGRRTTGHGEAGTSADAQRRVAADARVDAPGRRATGAGHRACAGCGRRSTHRRGIRAEPAGARGRAFDRPRPWHRRDRSRALLVAAHGARPRQGTVREGRGLELHRRVHGFERTAELRDALASPLLEPFVAVRDGRTVAYATGVTFFAGAYAVAETEQDLFGLITGALAATEAPASFLLPTRQGELLGACLAAGLYVVKPMTYMTLGEYREPEGAWFPSVLS